ncbi:MAG: tetratricopeptide repeat protein [Sedimentisphaerales bacterium]|nr:tetratricopeptide repeat protein [Sedimentisphaerales bacterium]
MKPIDSSTAHRIIFSARTLAIITVCFAAYIPAMKAGFIWDDDYYVTNNQLLTEPGGLYRIWTSGTVTSQYFPLTYTTFWLEYRLWGLNPVGYHVVNIAIHIINSLLLWLVLRRLSIPGAWFASAVFALHPVQVESVAWITERKNLLMLLFSLLSFLCWLKFVLDNKTGPKAILLYVASLLLFALALFGKATACTLPPAMLLILWFKRIPLRARRILEIFPFFVMAVGMGLFIMWWEQHHQGTGTINLGLNLLDRFLIAGRALWFYLSKLFWPVNLTFSYPRWNIDPAAIRQYLWPAAGILLIISAWLLRKRLGRAPLTAILFFAVTLFPVLGFFSLFTFMYTFVADHYQYAACIGPITLVAASGALFMRKSIPGIKFIVPLIASAVLLTLASLTCLQSGIYLDKMSLWKNTVNKNPGSFLANAQLFKLLFDQGNVPEAKFHLERALHLAPYVQKIDSRVYASLHYQMGLVLEKEGKLSDAAGQYQKVLDATDYFEVRMTAYYHLGKILSLQNNIEPAREHLLRAIEIARHHHNDYILNVASAELILLNEKSKHPAK